MFFTKHGVAVLASVLSSKRAVQMRIAIINAFIRRRKMVAASKKRAKRKMLEAGPDYDTPLLSPFQVSE